MTAPLTPNVCQTTFGGNSLTIDTPLYIVGNLCLAGNSDIIKEVGQPVDLQVGGKLIFTGNSTSVGVSTSTPITSGVVVGGCNKTGVTNSTTACTSASYPYYVNSAESFLQSAAPAETTSDIQNDYNTFDPGPKHSCLAGTTPAPLASSALDNDTTYNSSAATFELAPSSSYACISQNGASTGYLIWNNSGSSITVSGVTVPAHTLAINGSIFIDGNLTISQAVTYTGSGTLEIAGTATLANNSTTVCAESPCNTNASAWQGSSGNNSMLDARLARLEQRERDHARREQPDLPGLALDATELRRPAQRELGDRRRADESRHDQPRDEQRLTQAFTGDQEHAGRRAVAAEYGRRSRPAHGHSMRSSKRDGLGCR